MSPSYVSSRRMLNATYRHGLQCWKNCQLNHYPARCPWLKAKARGAKRKARGIESIAPCHSMTEASKRQNRRRLPPPAENVAAETVWPSDPVRGKTDPSNRDANREFHPLPGVKAKPVSLGSIICGLKLARGVKIRKGLRRTVRDRTP